jgi:hypothetical protein
VGQDSRIDVTAEVTPHHLMLTTDLLNDYDPTFKVNPPLRPAKRMCRRFVMHSPTARSTCGRHRPRTSCQP